MRSLCTVTMFFILTLSAFTQTDIKQGSDAIHMRIDQVLIDQDQKNFTIMGNGFLDDSPQQVRLGKIELRIDSITADEIKAGLPANLPGPLIPGVYLLTVSVGPSGTTAQQHKEFFVTIRSVGPSSFSGAYMNNTTFAGTNGNFTHTAACNPGDIAVGGGYECTFGIQDIPDGTDSKTCGNKVHIKRARLTGNSPQEPNAFFIQGHSEANGFSGLVQVVCLKITP